MYVTLYCMYHIYTNIPHNSDPLHTDDITSKHMTVIHNVIKENATNVSILIIITYVLLIY